MGRVLVITAEPESTDTLAQSDSDVPAKKPAGKNKKGVPVTDGDK